MGGMEAHFAVHLACGVQKSKGAYWERPTRLLLSVEQSGWPEVARRAGRVGSITSPEFQWSLKISSLNHNIVGYIAYRRNVKSYFYGCPVLCGIRSLYESLRDQVVDDDRDRL